jgi:hypothetical protein
VLKISVNNVPFPLALSFFTFIIIFSRFFGTIKPEKFFLHYIPLRLFPKAIVRRRIQTMTKSWCKNLRLTNNRIMGIKIVINCKRKEEEIYWFLTQPWTMPKRCDYNRCISAPSITLIVWSPFYFSLVNYRMRTGCLFSWISMPFKRRSLSNFWVCLLFAPNNE